MMPRSSSRLGWMLRFGWTALGGACAIVACSSNAHGPSGQGRAAPPVDVDGPLESPAVSNGGASTDALADAQIAKETGDDHPGSSPPFPDLYDANTIPKFELLLDAAAMSTLSSATRENKETWVHGQFKFGAITFADVGVRSKGSSTFRPLPNKASLKVKFNKWVKGQKLYGLEELTLNNMVSDRNFLRQRLTYYVFRSVGLPAPKANTAELTINGEAYGIYANVETPDERFLARVFGKNTRTLYEAHTPGTWLPGTDRRWEIDIAAPNAPPGTKPDLDLLFQAVAAAKDDTLLADLAGRLDTTQWLRFCATEAITAAYDGYAYGWWGSHNYFMAGDTNGKFSLIPWSTDGSLNDSSGVLDASKPQSDVVLVRCSRNATCWNAYKAEVKSVIAKYETLALVDLAHQWHDQIDALVKADPKREQSLEHYADETERLYDWLSARPGVVRAQLGL